LLRRMTLVTGDPFENLSDAADLLNRTGHPAEAIDFIADRVQAAPWDAAAKSQLGNLRAVANKDRDQGIPLMRAAAESGDALYDVRATAARFLSDAKAPVLTTASVELNLLSDPSPIPPASAEKPYFYRARVTAAAQSADLPTKIRLLQGAAAIDPNSPDTKLALFDAAYRAKRYQTAIGAVYPMLLSGGLTVPPEPEPSTAGQFNEEQTDNQYIADQFLSETVRVSRRGAPPAPLDPARRAVIARQLADANAKLNRIRDAAFYYRIALRLQPSDAASKTQINLLQAQIDRQRTNRLRRPVITANLEQDHVVRPRLAPSALPQGGGQ